MGDVIQVGLCFRDFLSQIDEASCAVAKKMTKLLCDLSPRHSALHGIAYGAGSHLRGLRSGLDELGAHVTCAGDDWGRLMAVGLTGQRGNLGPPLLG